MGNARTVASFVSGHFNKIRATALLGCRDFAIVSNNCWGAHIYKYAKKRFNTPFIGVFLSPTSYLNLLQEWPSCLQRELKFKSLSEEIYIEQIRAEHKTSWPVGYLKSGIEIQFMHYSSTIEAKAAWARRLARMPIVSSRIFFKFDDRDGASEKQLQSFETFPHANKVLFVAQANSAAGRITIPSQSQTVPDGLALSELSPQYFDSAAWISTRRQRPGSVFSVV